MKSVYPWTRATQVVPAKKYTQKGLTSRNFCYCTICESTISVSHGGLNDIAKHEATETHRSNVRDIKSNKSMTDCFKPAPVGTMSTKVDNARAIWATLMVQNNIPIAFADEFNKAVPVMFPDSDIVKKFRCGSTTTKKVVENIADYSIKSSLQLHSQDKWLYSISTDGGSKMLSKIYPILIYGYIFPSL